MLSVSNCILSSLRTLTDCVCFVGGLLIGRTVAVLMTMTLATSMAARQGPISMAGYQICLQVWLAVSLLNDALALAGQVLVFSCLLAPRAPSFE